MSAKSLRVRVTKLISAGLNSFMESMENKLPKSMMEEALREVDQLIEEVRTSLGKNLASMHLMQKKLSALNNEHSSLEEKAQIANQQNRIDLAEAAIKKQLDLEAQIPILEQNLGDLREEEQEMEGYLKALKAKKREMQEEILLFENKRQASLEGSTEAEKAGAPMEFSINQRLEKAVDDFNKVADREYRRVTSSSQDICEGKKLAELDEMTRDHQVKERLALLRSRLDT